MNSRWICAALIATVGTAAGASQVLATPATPEPQLHTTILAKSTFGPLRLVAQAQTAKLWKVKLKTRGQSDFYVVDNQFAGNGVTTGWHTHPGPSLIFVVHGTVTNYMSDEHGCPPHAYAAGSSFVDPGGADAHMLRNETDAPAETIAVQFLPTGVARRVDVPSVPPGCTA